LSAHVLVVSYRLRLDTCRSLKDKRQILKSLLSRVRQKFNISAVESGLNDSPAAAWITWSAVSLSNGLLDRTKLAVGRFIEAHFEVEIVEEVSEFS
jgi:uncharacterized protein YlxP (DUF503 family)